MDPLHKLNINLVIFGVVAFIQRMSLPYLNYGLIPVFVIISSIYLFKLVQTKEKLRVLSIFLRTFWLFFIIAAIFMVVALIHNKNFNSFTKRDIIHIFILTSFIFAIFTELKHKDQFAVFQFYFATQVFISSGLIAFLGLLKMGLTLSGINMEQMPLYNSSLSSDYNFYALSNILGLISAIFLLVSYKPGEKQKLLIQVVTFILSISIIFSTSRRGILFFVLFLILLCLVQNRKKYLSGFNAKAKLFFILFSIFVAVFTIYFSTYNSKLFFQFKRSEFNVNFVNNTLFQLAAKYGTYFGYGHETAIDLIPIRYDSRYPYTKWGRRTHKEVYPLSGNNSGIVPGGTVGYLLDRNSEAHTWSGNAYIITDISKLYHGPCIPAGTFVASVYCYVSDDFNGELVSIRSDGRVTGEKYAEYDLNNKGCWQKLIIRFSSESCPPEVILYVGKYNASDMQNLNGYVIFAYPVSESAELTTTYYKPLSDQTTYEAALSAFFSPRSIMPTSIERAYKITEVVSSSRLQRWKHGAHIFIREYSLKQKIFGNGFYYLSSYGKKFGEAGLDYPHNPLIDTLLYSGIAGFFFYLWFLLAGLMIYIKYSRDYRYFFVCYIVVSMFSLVSANTHFSIPVFTFLSIIPFLSYSIEREELSDNSLE